MLIEISEQVNVEQNTGRARSGKVNEGIQCYINTAKLNLHYNSKYGTLLTTLAKTTKTKHAAGNYILFGEYSNNFIEVYNVNQPFNALEMHQRNRHTRIL